MCGIYEADGGFVVYLTSKYLKEDVLERFESEPDAKKEFAAASKGSVWGQSLPVNSLPYTDLPGIYSKDPLSSGKSLLSRMKAALVAVRDTVKNWLARLLGNAAPKEDGLERGADYDFLRLNLERNGVYNGDFSFSRSIFRIGGAAAVRTSASDAIFGEQFITFER